MSDQLSLLLMDTDSSALPSLQRAFAELGWCVRATTKPEEALAISLQGRVHGIVSDFSSDALGLSSIERLRQSDPEACILVVGQGLDVRGTVNAIRAGADDVLEKPIDALLVDRRLREVLERRRSGKPPGPRDDPASLVLGETPAIRALREQIRTVARYRDLPVMITGETGTGKELVAQAIHALSAARGPFVPINCSAIPEALFESELFGHEAGAFTGARAPHAGLFEMAGNGTLMLDELGEMPSSLQPKLLRAIETRSFRRIGGSRDLPLRARIVSATHRRMQGRDSVLRSDLYYRLAGFTIATPALRNRAADIDLLAEHFLAGFCRHYGVTLRFSERALEALHAHHWPGNVRELRAVVEQAAVLSRDGRIGVPEIMAAIGDRQDFEATDEQSAAGHSGALRRVLPREPLRELERRAIQETWDSTGRNVSAAARALGLPRSTLRDRIRKYGLR